VTTVDLGPEVLNINLYRGDAWSVKFSARQPAPVGTVGAVLNLTGYTIAANIKGTDALVALTISPTDLVNGVIHFGQSAAAASGLYDLQLTPPAGLPRTYLRGVITVMDDITP